ncbi:histone H5-like [Pogonomyrmex barbatus]|uniref:Histone H5-like n=1 Tax=Pogonomyrmex barbatus TaxID=144034 RepID=A0A8N1S525_9HYME|nr:histone H5-like [Pogonomyrmex barbatus]
MPARRTPKVEALVVNAIRRLQDVQGSTSREISNYISQEYDVPIEETRRQVQLALRRGLSYGILKRSKRGYYSCNHDYLRQLSLGDGMSDGVMEPCPEQPWRFGVRARKRRKRRARLYARKRRKRLARERARRRRLAKEARERARKRRGRRPSRRRRRRPSRGRRRASRGRRPSRRRRGSTVRELVAR